MGWGGSPMTMGMTPPMGMPPMGNAIRAALAKGTRRFKAEDLRDLRFEVAWRGVAPQQDGFNEHGRKPLSEKDLGLL